MKNFIQPGNVVTLTAPFGGVKSGDGVLVGEFFGVAAYDALVGADVEVALVGVFELPKDAVAIDQGEKCYWDSGDSLVTNVTNTNTVLIGACTESVLQGAATVRVRLNGMIVGTE